MLPIPLRRALFIGTCALIAFLLGGFILAGCGTSRAAGIQADGHLAACPDSPNCVCSQDPSADRRIPAIAFTGTKSDAHRRLLTALASMPRTKIISDDGTYLHATSTTLLLRFTDDVELLIDDNAKCIHVRSLSRVGYSDLGVNRKRVETLREAFSATP